MKMEDVRLALRRPPKRLKDSYSIICSQTIGSGEARPYAGLPRSKMNLLSVQSLSDVMYQPWKGKELETV